MSKVLGKDVAVFIYDNGGWRAYACARTATLDVQTDFIDTTVTGSGNYSSIAPTRHSFTGTLDGVVNLDGDNKLNLPDLRQRQLAMQKLLMRFQRTDIDGNVYTDQAYFYISGSSDTGNYADIATFSISLRGTGAITQIFTPTTLALSAVRRIDFTSIDGQSTFTSPVLIGKEILDVNVDGISYADIIFSGTPINKQAVYDNISGSITIPQSLDSGIKVFVLYQDIDGS